MRGNCTRVRSRGWRTGRFMRVGSMGIMLFPGQGSGPQYEMLFSVVDVGSPDPDKVIWLQETSRIRLCERVTLFGLRDGKLNDQECEPHCSYTSMKQSLCTGEYICSVLTPLFISCTNSPSPRLFHTITFSRKDFSHKISTFSITTIYLSSSLVCLPVLAAALLNCPPPLSQSKSSTPQSQTT